MTSVLFSPLVKLNHRSSRCWSQSLDSGLLLHKKCEAGHILKFRCSRVHMATWEVHRILVSEYTASTSPKIREKGLDP